MSMRKKTQADIEGLKDLRENLDDLCRHQAKWAPEDYDLKNACFPPREGRITDLIAWRKGVTASGWESSDEEDEDGEEVEEDEDGEDGEEDEEEREDQEHQMDASKHGELEDMLDKPVSQTNGDILLEDPLEVQAADDEIIGKDLNIIDTAQEAILEGEQEEVVLDSRRKEGTPAVEVRDQQHRRQLLQDEYDALQLRVDAMRARQRDITVEMGRLK
jgi:hypothetical protein